MKRKLLLVVCALILGSTIGFAKEDVTNTYLTNANLSSLDGWTILEGTMGHGGYQDWQTNGDVPVIEFYHSWDPNPDRGAIGSTKTFNFSQKVTLPAGYYRLAVNAFYREGGNGNGTNTKAYIYAGTKQQYVTGFKPGDLNGYTGSNDLYKAANAFSKGAFSNEFDFHVSEETEIEIGFHGYIDTYCSWCILGPVTLWEYTAADYMEDYREKVKQAEPLLSQKMNASVLQALQAAIVEESTLLTPDDVQNAVSKLTNAILDANNSIASYSSLKSAIEAYDAKCTLFDSYGIAAADAAGAAAAKEAYTNGTATDGTAQKTALDAAYTAGVLATKQPGNGMDMTVYVTNPDFNAGNYNGWTRDFPYGGNCQIQGGSRMEYWAGGISAENRALASFNIYQELTNLPAGVYTVSADMYNSLNSEGGSYTVFSPTCGVYGSSSNEEVALVTEDGTTLNTYTTGEVLVYSGHLTLGTKNTVTPMAARWFVFDNVKLTYVRQLTQEELDANKVPTGITLDPASFDLTIYGTQTITANIIPGDATDKSVTWTTSDPTVATVDNGVVTAVGVGSATITAKANGAENVSTTATVTVTDVEPVAAPAFYSELAAGDFYIVNAATGKFLGGANSWGTQASQIEHGLLFTVALNNGKYTLDSHTFESNDKHFFNGTYIDGVSTSLSIESKGDGKYSISTAEGSQFVTAKPGTTVVDNTAVNANSSLAQWYFISKNDRDKMLAAATAENPADATYYIEEANFSRNWGTTGKNVSAWTGVHEKGGDNSNMNAKVENTAADVYQTIKDIPNGTYTLSVQAVSSGTAKFYANDVEQEIESKDDVNSQTTASNEFGAGYFKRSLTVTVTNRTLKVGVKSDDTDKVLYFDNFELLMTNYIPVTGVTAEIDNEEFEAGQTAQITAATVPAAASFNALTYTSGDESIATVDENGVVTGVAVGSTTITVAANEMEDFSTTVDVTVTYTSATADDYAALATAIEAAEAKTLGFEEGEYAPYNNIDAVTALDAAKAIDPTAQNTQAAVQTAIETLNDAWVVNTTEVNAIWDGSFEHDYSGQSGNVQPIGWYRNEGTYTGDGYNVRYVNIPSGVEGNTSGHGLFGKFTMMYGKETGYTLPLKAGYYKLTYSYGGWNEQGERVIKLYNDENTATVDPSTVKAKNNTGHTTASSWAAYSGLILVPADGDYVLSFYRQNTTSQNQIVITDIKLFRATEDEICETILAEAYALYENTKVPEVNIGTGAFQYNEEKINTYKNYVQTYANYDKETLKAVLKAQDKWNSTYLSETLDVIKAFVADMQTLNAPAADQLFNIVVATEGHVKKGNAVIIIPGATTNNNPTGYALNANFAANVNLSQAFTFTKVEGNTYTISAKLAEGTVYLTNGTKNGSAVGWKSQQIQATTNPEKAMAFKIAASANEGAFNIYNTETNSTIACQTGGNIYTEAGNADFCLAETTMPSIAINTTEAGYGTIMLPFAAEIPSGVTVYSCADVDGNTLTLNPVDAIEANKPYIIKGDWNETLTGDAQGTALTYTADYLTGVYESTEVPVGSYVLQNQEEEDGVAFYLVDEDPTATTENASNFYIKPNRAYLTVPAGANVRALFFPESGDATGINGLEVLTSGSYDAIYTAGGAKVNSLQKGLNIVVKDGKSYKIFVK